jgi:hypothetical protein
MRKKDTRYLQKARHQIRIQEQRALNAELQAVNRTIDELCSTATSFYAVGLPTPQNVADAVLAIEALTKQIPIHLIRHESIVRLMRILVKFLEECREWIAIEHEETSAKGVVPCIIPEVQALWTISRCVSEISVFVHTASARLLPSQGID